MFTGQRFEFNLLKKKLMRPIYSTGVLQRPYSPDPVLCLIGT